MRSLLFRASRQACKVSGQTPANTWQLHEFRELEDAPLASTGVSTSRSGPDAGHDDEPLDESTAGDVSAEDRARAGAALRASFARLSPQGSDEWNFMGAFTHLGDRYGPYQPGTSDLADLLANQERLRQPARPAGSTSPSAGEEEKSDVEDAMTHVVEAFRFLHARVSTLEARAEHRGRPARWCGMACAGARARRMGRAARLTRHGTDRRRRGPACGLW